MVFLGKSNTKHQTPRETTTVKKQLVLELILSLSNLWCSYDEFLWSQSVLPLVSMFSLFNMTSPVCGSELFILTGHSENRSFIYKSIQSDQSYISQGCKLKRTSLVTSICGVMKVSKWNVITVLFRQIRTICP